MQRFCGRFFLNLLMMMCLSVSGCNRKTSSSTDGTIELELWTLALRPRFTTYMEDLCHGFEKENPGVKVVWVDVPFEAMGRKLVASAAAGRAPDVVNLSDGDFARFASLGAMLDLSPHLSQQVKREYLPGVLRVALLQNQWQAVPWYLTTSVTLVNSELLGQGGLKVETVGRDWKTLRAQARQYHKQTGKFLFSMSLGQESELPVMMLADGLPMLVAKGTDRLQANLLDPAIVAMVRDWVALYREGALPREAATGGHAHLVRLYQDGQIACVQVGANFLVRVKDAAPNIYQHTQVLGPITGELGRAHVAVMLLGVTRQSKHPELAAKLAAYVTRATHQLAFGKIVNILPSTSASLEDAHFQPVMGDGENWAQALAGEKDKLVQARWQSARALREAVAFTPTIEPWPAMRRVFNENIKAALLEGREVETTLGEIQTRWNQLLDAAKPVGLEALPQEEEVAKWSSGQVAK